MNQHFFKITATYSDKNKLYKDLREYIESWDGTLLTTKQCMEEFTYKLGKTCAELNRKHYRCKPIEIQQGEHQTGSKNSVYVPGSWHAELYEVKQICR